MYYEVRGIINILLYVFFTHVSDFLKLDFIKLFFSDYSKDTNKI